MYSYFQIIATFLKAQNICQEYIYTSSHWSPCFLISIVQIGCTVPKLTGINVAKERCKFVIL